MGNVVASRGAAAPCPSLVTSLPRQMQFYNPGCVCRFNSGVRSHGGGELERGTFYIGVLRGGPRGPWPPPP